jgi:predicted nucleic acid-binding protein
MPSKHPRIAVTADPELGDALDRVRAVTGTQETDASLVRRLAVEGAEVELQAGREMADAGSHRGHRLPLTDLTVAVAAQASGLDVLHYDHHFERLGELLGVRTVWIADPSM